MAKSKADEWLEQDKLTLLEGWARNGLTDEQIAHNMGIRRETLYEYKKRHPNIANALKKGKEVVDLEVENALLKSALSGNITAQIFWLKNRKPKIWRDKVQYENSLDEITKLDKILNEIKNEADK
jgi:hypothetical protein